MLWPWFPEALGSGFGPVPPAEWWTWRGWILHDLGDGSPPWQCWAVAASQCRSSFVCLTALPEKICAPSHSTGIWELTGKKSHVPGFWVMRGNNVEVENTTLRNEGVTFPSNMAPWLREGGGQKRALWLSRPFHLISFMNLSTKACGSCLCSEWDSDVILIKIVSKELMRGYLLVFNHFLVRRRFSKQNSLELFLCCYWNYPVLKLLRVFKKQTHFKSLFLNVMTVVWKQYFIFF